MKRRVIIDLPKGQSGLEVKMKNLRAGLGFNANTMPWPVMAGKMSEPKLQVNSTLRPVPREEANLEAEKDEVAALPTKSGIPDTFKIGGKRHHLGGTPLNLPSDSFIFSDTAKMRIKDPAVLAQFGMPERKNGYTPAEIAKKYDVNSFKKILMDPDADKLQKQTAELMISNYNLKLAKLAIIQESMKGFPQGIPAIAMPYIEEMGIDPAQFVQMNPGGAQDEQAQTQQGEMDDVGAEARFGGYMEDGGYIDYFQPGGPKYSADPALSDVVSYLNQRNLEEAKKAAHYEQYKRDFAAQKAKEKLEHEQELARQVEASGDYIIKNELKRREQNIKQLKAELESGKEQFGIFSFPASGNTKAKLEKELAEYNKYLNQVNARYASKNPAAQSNAVNIKDMDPEQQAYYRNLFKKSQTVESDEVKAGNAAAAKVLGQTKPATTTQKSTTPNTKSAPARDYSKMSNEELLALLNQ